MRGGPKYRGQNEVRSAPCFVRALLLRAGGAECHRRETDVLLEIAAEEGLVGESQRFGDLLDARIGIGEQLLRLGDNEHHDPLQGVAARFFPDDRGEIARGEALFRGVERNAVVRAEILGEREDETLENPVLAILFERLDRMVEEVGLGDFAAERLAERREQLLVYETVIFIRAARAL